MPGRKPLVHQPRNNSKFSKHHTKCPHKYVDITLLHSLTRTGRQTLHKRNYFANGNNLRSVYQSGWVIIYNQGVGLIVNRTINLPRPPVQPRGIA